MDPGAVDPVPVTREFDGKAMYAALDARRRAECLSWPSAARAIWDMAPALNAARDARGLANHPISAATLHRLGRAGNTSCQHALFFLRWLDRTPESFLVGAAPDAGAPLPACGPGRRPRWDLKALHAALNESRKSRGATWAQAAQNLRCHPGQLTGLQTARFAAGMVLAMRISQWIGRPAADFIYPARW
jgi:hypothetical protein